MSIQVGTVDGLVNIGPIITDCFVKAIDSFSREGYDYAKNKGVAIGAAFQRYTYPVYSGQSSEFNVTSIDSGVYTKTGNEQSPAYMTYCKKMGLLDVDEKDNRFRLTGLGQMLFNGTITLQEYAFILLTKQGVFVNGIYKNSLMSILYDVLEENPIVTSDSIEKYIVDFYKDKSVDKTRFDILLGAFFAAGLLYKIKNQYVISCIAAAKIIAELKSKENELSPAVLDTNDEYSRYMGAYKYGVFDILNRNNLALFEELYPNIKPVYRIINKTTIGIPYCPYLTALRTKPFMLLAGISGTGKSRIVREMAKACWKEGDPEYGKNYPRNFCMVQVKPNWHDSSELIGYVSRLNGEKFVVGPFLRFLAAAIKDPDTPYFLCLDEMNLAPVEQYFAEYLSVIESRKLNDSGIIETDPIVPFEDTVAYGNLIDQLFDTPEERKAYKTAEGGKRLTIPQNFFVVGTVNMDETTVSFSRKVLDRAMTIEMNEVDLHGGLEHGAGNEIGYIGNSIIGDAAEGCDVYEDNHELCDQVLAYLEQVNAILEVTPFKIAYRTRNEFLMYAVNRKKLDEKSQLWQSLDEMTSMKILSRIEGDEERTKKVLDGLKALVEEQIVAQMPTDAGETPALQSISAAKIDEMLAKLKATGFTSYWA